MQVRIYYEDTDCGGIVYHTNYLKYCERARSELFFNKNSLPNTDSIGFVVMNIEASFFASAKLGDILRIQSDIIKLGKSSIIFKQSIYLEDKIIFSANVKLACIDVANKKVVRIPDHICRILKGE